MARIVRLVVPGPPHHVIRRGNRRMTIFFSHEDYRRSLDLLAGQGRKAGVKIWSYCLMSNHVHLILVPARPQALGRAAGETHRRYSGVIDAHLRMTGHLFQARSGSAVMDEDHLAAARDAALNPVRAQLIARARDWPSSTRERILRAGTMIASASRRDVIAEPAGSPI